MLAFSVNSPILYSATTIPSLIRFLNLNLSLLSAEEKMGKQTKTKKAENLGKGKVTQVQVAFIVDRYLSDNNYTQTRSIFRTEASILISKTQVREAPKSLLSLGAILDEYICLKEQKVMLDQEKCRVETLLQGMQNVMNAYNSPGSISQPSVSAATPKSVPLVPQSNLNTASPAGFAMYKTPITNSVPGISNRVINPTNFSTQITNIQSTNKRKGSRLVPDPAPTAKRQMPSKLSPARGASMPLQESNPASTQKTIHQVSEIQSLPHNHLPKGSTVQRSSVVKSLFKQPSQSSPANSPGPKTPPQAFPSQSDKPVSPSDSSSLVNSTADTSQETTLTNCSVVSSETVNVSPFKHIAYYSMERNHYISSSPMKTNSKRQSKRDHVKGRLDFDGSDVLNGSEKPVTADISTSGSNGEADFFDMDFPNFDVFGADFSLSELLVDIDLDCEGNGFSYQPAVNPLDSISRSPCKSRDGSSEVNQEFSELSSTVTEVFSEKDMNIQGPDSLTSVKSITKCIRILSPAKSRCSLLEQENL